MNREVSNEFRPSLWITDVIPRKSPFVPQMGDEVCTHIQTVCFSVSFLPVVGLKMFEQTSLLYYHKR